MFDTNVALATVKTMAEAQLALYHGVDIEYILNQVNKGIKVEMEHTTDKEVAREIACDHIREIKDYYTRLEGMEKQAKYENL